MGVHTYYGYLNKFKLLDKTGIDLPGEANSIFLAENKAGPVELATISFGQRFEITPLQLITAVSSIANANTSGSTTWISYSPTTSNSALS